MTWTPDEIAAVRAALMTSASRFESEISAWTISDTDLGPRDELDVASTHIASSQTSAEVENATLLLDQTRHVISRLDAGLYGSCETCGTDIARERLEAFPRATSCVPCLEPARV